MDHTSRYETTQQCASYRPAVSWWNAAALLTMKTADFPHRLVRDATADEPNSLAHAPMHHLALPHQQSRNPDIEIQACIINGLNTLQASSPLQTGSPQLLHMYVFSLYLAKLQY